MPSLHQRPLVRDIHADGDKLDTRRAIERRREEICAAIAKRQAEEQKIQVVTARERVNYRYD